MEALFTFFVYIFDTESYHSIPVSYSSGGIETNLVVGDCFSFNWIQVDNKFNHWKEVLFVPLVVTWNIMFFVTNNCEYCGTHLFEKYPLKPKTMRCCAGVKVMHLRRLVLFGLTVCLEWDRCHCVVDGLERVTVWFTLKNIWFLCRMTWTWLNIWVVVSMCRSVWILVTKKT